MTEQAQQTAGLVVLGIFFATLLIEALGGHHRHYERSWRDRLFALAGLAAHAMLSAPVVAFGMALMTTYLFPETANRFADTPFWLAFPIIFLLQELSHYWLHRWSHEKRWLWKLHRTHHSATHLNALVLYRYNVFWTVILPQTWIGAITLHLGMPEVFMACVLIEFAVNALTHTPYRWDLALRRLPGMTPVFNVLEKIITLPDTHHAHHGLGRHAHARGNYAITLFCLDVLMGTARIPRARQERFGLPGRFDWKEELFWPVFRQKPQPRKMQQGT